MFSILMRKEIFCTTGTILHRSEDYINQHNTIDNSYTPLSAEFTLEQDFKIRLWLFRTLVVWNPSFYLCLNQEGWLLPQWIII